MRSNKMFWPRSSTIMACLPNEEDIENFQKISHTDPKELV